MGGSSTKKLSSYQLASTNDLSPYEIKRLERIRRNEAKLKALGLVGQAKGTAVKAARKTSSPKRNSTVAKVTPSRSSRRLKKQHVQYTPPLDALDGDTPKTKRKIVYDSPSRKSNYRVDIPVDLISSPLTLRQKNVIETKMEDDFLGKFEDYLDTVDPLSYQNKRNVIKQITKMVNGEGIRYESPSYGWPEGCFFCKGIKVGPADDILSLLRTGKECEDEWGKDHGNGWLLRHPLKKLYMFQQYHLEN